MSWLRYLWNRFCGLFGIGSGGSHHFLCDTCKYDYGNVCKRPERPNVAIAGPTFVIRYFAALGLASRLSWLLWFLLAVRWIRGAARD